jgi:hypothetical protein
MLGDEAFASLEAGEHAPNRGLPFSYRAVIAQDRSVAFHGLSVVKWCGPTSREFWPQTGLVLTPARLCA